MTDLQTSVVPSVTPTDPPVAVAAASATTAPARPRTPGFLQSASGPVWAGLVVTGLGFGLIFYSWIKVAATLDVGRQMPYVVSGAMLGLGLIVVGIAIVDMTVRRQDRTERRHQLAVMQHVLGELREVLADEEQPRP